MRFVLLVEGETEAKVLPCFISRWLNAGLSFKVGIRVENLRGEGHFRREYARLASKYLASPAANEIIAVIGIIDLYGLHFPAHCRTVRDKHDWAKGEFEKAVKHPKFMMFFAVHEIEAWILAAPSVLPRDVREALPKSVKDPESVNFNNPPGTLLSHLYQDKLGRRYRKIVDGANLFARLDPREVSEKCKYLQNMLQALMDMAKSAK